MQTYNGLSIEVYSSGTTRIADPSDVLQYAYGLNYSTGFPGGLYLDCSFYVPRDLASYWAVRGAQRVVIRNGQKVVYEGKIDNLAGNAEEGGAEGTEVQCTGYWGALAMRYAIRKRWADKRITEDVWKYVTTGTGAGICTVDRNNRIRFTPKEVAWVDAQWAAVLYTMPIGRTAKRITYIVGLQEGAQAWEAHVERSTDNSSWTEVKLDNGDSGDSGRTTSGSGSKDITLGEASRYLRLVFIARAAQTPPADGTIYGQFSNITVYDETGAINALEIGYDLIGACSELSTSLTGVHDGLAAETLPALDQFAFDDFTPIADIATAAAAYGNTSDESLYFQVRSSEDAETNNGKPLLAAGVYPDLTSADYVVRLSGQNVVSASINRDYSNIRNWIAVNYMDEKNERQVISPDDAGYTALTDATSTAAYGRRVDTITSGGYETQKFLNQLRSDRIAKRMYGGDAIINATAALALYYGKRHLARWKDPLWSGTITVVGYINGSGGNEIPASEIEAGKVLDIADYIADEILPSDTLDYPRVIITATSYDADTETCVISFGPLDEFQMIQAENRYFVSYDTPATSGDTDAGGKKDNLNWKRQYGLKPGTAMWDEAVRLGKKAFLAKYPNLKRVRKK